MVQKRTRTINNKGKVLPIIILAVVLLFLAGGYYLYTSDYFTHYRQTGNIAHLVQSSVTFAPGELRKLIWLQVDSSSKLLFTKDSSIKTRVFLVGGSQADSSVATINASDPELPGVSSIRFMKTDVVYFIEFTRTNSSNALKIETRVKLNEEVWAGNNQGLINSPLLQYPSGEQYSQLPPNSSYSSLSELVQKEYGYDSVTGKGWLSYLVDSEVVFVDFLEASPDRSSLNTILSRLFSLVPRAHAQVSFTGHGVPSPFWPPDDAEHDDNYCGMFSFIHSMNTYFPGSIGEDPLRIKHEWDKVGDGLDHSNWFGVTASEMVAEINENYGSTHPFSRDGVKYCARELENPTLQQLAEISQHCNIKILMYDLSAGFGHWVDMTSISGNRITVQDYEKTWTASYNDRQGSLDLSQGFSSNDSVTAEALGSIHNARIGDGYDESIHFVVVCPCSEIDTYVSGQTTTTHTTTEVESTPTPEGLIYLGAQYFIDCGNGVVLTGYYQVDEEGNKITDALGNGLDRETGQPVVCPE